MASTWSSLKFELIGTGEQSGTWGDTTNANLGDAIEQAIGGKADITMSSTSETLTLTDTTNLQDARALYLNLSGTPGGAATLNVPAVEKAYIVRNGTNQQVTVKVTGQTGVVVPTGKVMALYDNGTDVVDTITHLTSLTLGSALPVASGGTGVTTSTGTGSVVLSTSPTLTTPALGTPSSGTLTSCTGLPISTGVSGLGSGVATFLATPSSTNLAAAVTGETGSGSLVFATSPTLVTPVLGAASATSVTLAAGAVGTPSLTTTGDTNTGIFFPAADEIAFAEGGVEALRITSAGFTRPTAYADTVVALGNTGTSKTITLTSGNVFTATLTGNCTFTLSNPIATGSSSFTLILTNDGTAGRTVAWSGGTFLFPGGASSLSRTTTANAIDVWVFFTPDGGTTWYGNIAMKNMAA